MEEEESVVEVNLCDCSTSLAVGRHVGQFVVVAECFARRSGTYTTGEVVLLAYDVFPDAVDGVDVGSIACEGSHIGHTGIHVSSTYGMTYGFILLEHWLVALCVFVDFVQVSVGIAHTTTSACPRWVALSALVEEVLGLLQVFLVASSCVEFCQTHLGNLVSGDYLCLSGLATYFAAHTVGILHCDGEQRLLACCVVVSYGSFAEVAEVVELVREVFYQFPSLRASPVVWLLWVLCTCGVEVSIGFLCRCDDGNHAVAVLVDVRTVDFGVGVSLHQVCSTFECLVGVSVVERVSHGHAEGLAGVLDVLGCLFEVEVALFGFALAECERDCYVAACLQALSPEGIWSDLHCGKRHGCDWVARLVALCIHTTYGCYGHKRDGD